MSPPVAYPVQASEAETADAVNLTAPADVTLVLDSPAPSAEPGTCDDTPEAEDPADGASGAEPPSPADSDSPPVHVGSASQPCQVWASLVVQIDTSLTYAFSPESVLSAYAVG